MSTHIFRRNHGLETKPGRMKLAGANSRLKKGFGKFKHLVAGNRFVRNPSFQRGLLIFATSAILTALLSPSLLSYLPRYKEGDVAREDIRSPSDLLVEDKISTEQKVREAESRAAAVYDFDTMLLARVEKRVGQSFAMMRRAAEEYMRSHPGADRALLMRLYESKRADFEKKLGIRLSDSAFRALTRRDFEGEIENYLFSLVAPSLVRGVATHDDIVRMSNSSNVVIKDLKGESEYALGDVSAVESVEFAKQNVEARGLETLINLDRDLKWAIIEIAKKMLEPNIRLNRAETERRRKEAIKEVKPVFYVVKKGEIILREGERVQPEHLAKLAAIRKKGEIKNTWHASLGLFSMILIVLSVLCTIATLNVNRFARSMRDFSLICMLLLGQVLIVRLGIFIAEATNRSFPFVPAAALYFAIPFALGAMLVGMFLGAESAFVFTIPAALFGAMLFDGPVEMFALALVGSLVAIQGVVYCSARSALLLTGARVGLVSAVVILLLQLQKGKIADLDSVYFAAAGVLGGLSAGVLATGLTPAIESIFGYVTNIKLLELASLNQKALRDLAVKAPGTYHHSIIVGNLAEAAAEAINANPLLAKVGAYYHDIGKMKMPEYFIENQAPGENKHDRLSPSMSSLILTTHVKDGVELAKKNRLGKPIIDIIRQHHGSSIIKFFYDKARMLSGPKPVDEERYRYPGPKPKTKEAGVIMLADAIEAASRALREPTASRIKGLVHKMINQYIAEGQLDECDLTMKDLDKIAACFTRILCGIYHQRIDYPESVVKELRGGKKNGSPHTRPAKSG